MSNTTTTDSTAGKIEFIQFHEPALQDGDYEITVTQTIESADKIPKVTFPTNPETKLPEPLLFSVAGPRFSLSPQEIHSVFPPDGSLGEHSNVLPHIILNRSTLPWERSADSPPPKDATPPPQPSKDVPPRTWLALLLFDDDEKPTPQVVQLKTLTVSAVNPAWPGVTEESAQHDDDKVTVIDIPKNLLAQIVPSQTDLAWLAHVRQATDKDGKLIGDELAVIICNRLPQPSGTSTVHLVSVEGRYDASGFVFPITANDKVRLVSLKSWSFSCVDEKQTFQGLLRHLDSGTLRLPQNDNAVAEGFLAGGFVPLPHFIREGSKTVSWYHGPLMPGPNQAEIELPVLAADQLVRYDTGVGMFDVSYASAWELGRLLALQSNNFSVNLFNWKRQHAQELRRAEQQEIHPPLTNNATNQQSNTELAVPDDINNWFRDLSLLKGLPFNYLVPDERMLPPESIRFFQVDPLWIECLMDGAFSIGRVSDADHARDAAHETIPPAHPHGPITGFLLRSNVVSGWPGLLVDASAADIKPIPTDNKLELLRMDRLSANVLLCLFKGEIKTVDIHQKPETLHFGLDVDADKSNSHAFKKILRDSTGKELEGQVITPILWKKPDSNQLVVDISLLAGDVRDKVLGFSNFTSAEFALEMIEGVQLVRFQ